MLLNTVEAKRPHGILSAYPDVDLEEQNSAVYFEFGPRNVAVSR